MCLTFPLIQQHQLVLTREIKQLMCTYDPSSLQPVREIYANVFRLRRVMSVRC